MGIRIFNIVGTLVLLCVFDGCVFRDPDYELPAGYRLSAISPSSPAMVCCTKFDTTANSSAKTTANRSFSFGQDGDYFGGITDWACDEAHLIGKSDSGWFVLQFSARRADIFDDHASWERELEARTRLRPTSLEEPSSAAIGRPRVVQVIYVIVLLVGIIPNLIPARASLPEDG